MPLTRYGVLLGTFDHFGPSQQGHWYHGEIYVRAGSRIYQSAVDVDTQSTVKVQYRVFRNLDAAIFAAVLNLVDGYHDLLKTPTSGAIDYIRSPLFKPSGAPAAPEGLTPGFSPWTDSNGDNAIAVLQGEVKQSSRLFVFGEPFTTGLGMHNVHMNQGDPSGSFDGIDHQVDDGIWQDGGTLIQRADGSLHAVLTKFSSQSLQTNDQGLPI